MNSWLLYPTILSCYRAKILALLWSLPVVNGQKTSQSHGYLIKILAPDITEFLENVTHHVFVIWEPPVRKSFISVEEGNIKFSENSAQKSAVFTVN